MKLNLKIQLFMIIFIAFNCHSDINPQKKISLNFNEAPIELVLLTLAEYQSLQLILLAPLNENITLKLENIPWYQAITFLEKHQQLTIQIDDNLMLVSLSTKDKLTLTEVPSDPVINQASTTLSLQYISAETAMQYLRPYLSPQGKVVIDQGNQSLLITDSSDRIKAIQQHINLIEYSQLQVEITAYIVTISRDKLLEIGVKWDLGNPISNTNRIDINQFSVSLPLNEPSTNISFNMFTINNRLLALELSALEYENQAEIIASPKLITANMKKAVIKQGTEIPYEVASGSSGGTSIEFREAMIGMEVTPKILADGRIELILFINQNTPGRPLKSGQKETLSIDKQEINTQVSVFSGETVVLGGIFQQMHQSGVDKVPGLGNIPIIGRLFQRSANRSSRKELVIFVTPSIVK